MRGKWIERGSEPSLRELMDDPLTQAVMRRDGLTAEEIWMAIRDAQRKLAAPGSSEVHAGVVRSERRKLL
ncbi:hypothetical protein [Defluviicoccus vanus]|uniref:Uncharacterized protein n=1 Tax=Defluviicoccus vanus TaxID=111831 RepID=A0A7H1MXH4_9PROT|nr:hypothetical protein [Defluviicoccus vanus]QNT68160.1 hypothetical protein HQ394_00750 [Defluviicoccus vanus]